MLTCGNFLGIEVQEENQIKIQFQVERNYSSQKKETRQLEELIRDE